MSCFDAQRCVVVAEGGGSAKILTTSNGGEDWRETLQPSSGSLMSVQCMENGEAWAGGGVLGVRVPPPPRAHRPARLLLRSRLTRRRPSQFPTFTAHYWHTSNYGESWHLHEMEGACKPALPFRPLLSRLREAAVQTHLTSASHRVKRRWDSRPSSPQVFRGLRATRTEVGKLGSELCSNIHTWYINATCARTNGQAL